jgi:hypothetical protein
MSPQVSAPSASGQASMRPAELAEQLGEGELDLVGVG